MGNESHPLVTVIIAVYNAKATLRQCLDSVILQTYRELELIVVDGGSSDGTVDMLNEYSQQISYWISEPDRGIYNAWNKAIAQAKGEWICFLGADDFLWDEQVLSQVALQLVRVPPEIGVAYGKICLLSNEGRVLYSIGEPWEEVRERFRQLMCIPHPATLQRRSLFTRRGCFDESFRIAGDYEWLLRELKDGDAYFIPDLVFAAMRQGGVSSDPANTLLGLKEVRLAQRKNGLRWPGLTWLMALARAYTRLLLWAVVGERMTRSMLDFGRRIRGLPEHWTRT